MSLVVCVRAVLLAGNGNGTGFLVLRAPDGRTTRLLEQKRITDTVVEIEQNTPITTKLKENLSPSQYRYSLGLVIIKKKTGRPGFSFIYAYYLVITGVDLEETTQTSTTAAHLRLLYAKGSDALLQDEKTENVFLLCILVQRLQLLLYGKIDSAHRVLTELE